MMTLSLAMMTLSLMSFLRAAQQVEYIEATTSAWQEMQCEFADMDNFTSWQIKQRELAREEAFEAEERIANEMESEHRKVM